MSVPGTMGRIAVVDLAAGTVGTEAPDDELYLKYLGGYGLGAHYLYTRMPANADPLGPDSLLGFFAGPLTGTPAICGNRFQVVGKSPKTGGFGDSNCGGDFGPQLKFAGFDGILFSGISDEPVYLLLDGGNAELKSAAGLWGLDAAETEKRLKDTHGADASVCSIGPPAEALSLLACIMNDGDRAAGRSGLGTVMGSKKIKAVVAVPSMQIPLADEAAMRDRRSACIKAMRDGNPLFDLFSTFGTAGLTAGAVASGDCPVKNWAGSADDFPNAASLSDEAVKDVVSKPYGCWRCPVACGGFIEIDYKGETLRAGKPEYETLGAFGPMLLIDDLPAICKVNEICNRVGLDTISTGCTLAFAFECYEKGILTGGDTGGLELTWGNADAMVALTEQIARREGFGAVLADGSKVAADRIGKGAIECAMQVHGEELPMHDPRLSPGLASSYKLDATPARHTQFSAWAAEAGFPILGAEDHYGGWTPDKKYEYTGKAKAHRVQSALMHVVNAEGCCMFGTVCITVQDMIAFLNGAMGAGYDLEDLLAIGDRIANLRVAFNLREGVRNAAFRLPPRVIGNPPLQAGATKGVTVDLDVQQNEYFEEMGWSPEGVPSAASLERLGLSFVVPDLHA